MNAMMKFDSQFDDVQSAIPLARARKGNISAPNNHGHGPHLRENIMFGMFAYGERVETHVAPKKNKYMQTPVKIPSAMLSLAILSGRLSE